MKKLMLIVIVLVMMLSMAVLVYAGGYSGTVQVWETEDPFGKGHLWGTKYDVRNWYLPLNGDVGSQSALLGFDQSIEAFTGTNMAFDHFSSIFDKDYLDNHELLIYRFTEEGQPNNKYVFLPLGTVLSSAHNYAGYPTRPDLTFDFTIKMGHDNNAGYFWYQSVRSFDLEYWNAAQHIEELLYYSGDFADGSTVDSDYEFNEDGDYIAPAFEFTCFGGKEPDEDGFIRATGLIVDGMDQLSLCFPYLYYKIYPGSQALNNYELRIYEDSMFSENHTLRARITYPEMKDLEVDKTYTYIQSINTYFPIAKNTKYWLTIYDRKAGQAVYTLPVETSAMARMQANVEHFHIYQVQDGNTVGNPDDYNYEGFFDPFDDIIGGWEPDVPPGDWNEPVPGQLDFANIGEIDEWFSKISGFSSDFVGYVSSVFTFVPAEYWVLIMIGVAIAVLLRIFAR